ncbi:Regulatory myosin light chain [Cavenderia fasciculata]|uniref:Regulatory myosin light chain n=1 Tax=Cavenderia fasciculata TaxID=261658 RepID=F4PJA5_CACFS|nr:Regulatory myosin light chain [Cavenderia fasciculata]EGG24391.1 Regulatory myosin light chain [Cavenderia fasciculata]|eukprot:XP_004362242.1 Regulatory myosin light chain [Cavenderia fasciculata]
MNNNNSDNLNVLPSTIAKIIIDLVLYCDWVSDDNTTNNRRSLIDNALNLSRVSKRWLKITSCVFVQYYTTRLQFTFGNIDNIKRLQQSIESPFCLLYHQALPKVELVFGYDYKQVLHNIMKQVVLFGCLSPQQKETQKLRVLQLLHQQQRQRPQHQQFSILKHQLKHYSMQPLVLLKPMQQQVIKHLYNNEKLPKQQEEQLRLLYSSSGGGGGGDDSEQSDELIYNAIRDLESERYPPNIIDKHVQSAIYNQQVQLFTNREVFGQITTLDIYTFDDIFNIDVDVLTQIVQHGNQLTTLFLDGNHNQKVCQAVLPIAMNLTTLAFRDSLVYRDNAINNNNNPKKEYNNHNTLERLYLATPDYTNILNNIFISSSGLVFNNLKFLQIKSYYQSYMPWKQFHLTLPNLQVLKMEGDLNMLCPNSIEYLIARGGEVQYIGPVYLTLETSPLIQYLPYYLNLIIDIDNSIQDITPIRYKYHPSLLELTIHSIITSRNLFNMDYLESIPFATLKSLKLVLSHPCTVAHLDRFKQLESLFISIPQDHRWSDIELICLNISQIQSLISLDLHIGDGNWNIIFKQMIKQLVNLKIFKTGKSNLYDDDWIPIHFTIQLASKRRLTREESSVVLGEDQVAELKEAFELFDKDRVGVIKKEALKTTLKQFGIFVTAENFDEMFAEADTTKTGGIAFPEFMSMMSRRMKQTSNEQILSNAFKTFDPEGLGYIPTKDLAKALTTLGDKLNEAELEELKAVSENEQKQIKYELFVNTLFAKK